MGIPREISKRLRDVLGEHEGDGMSEWLDGLDSHIEDLRQERRADLAELRQEVHGEFADVRQEMRVGFATLREELRTSNAELRTELRTSNAELREEMRVNFARFREEMTSQIASQFRWAMGLWMTSFAAIVAVMALFRGR